MDNWRGVCALLCFTLKNIINDIPVFLKFIVVSIVSLAGYVICICPMLIRQIICIDDDF